MVTLVRMAMMQVQVLWREEILKKPLCDPLKPCRWCLQNIALLKSFSHFAHVSSWESSPTFAASRFQLSEEANGKCQFVHIASIKR